MTPPAAASQAIRAAPTALVLVAVATGCAPAAPSSNPPDAATTPQTTSRKHVTIARPVDGDTLRLADGTRVRVLGIDTPERGTHCAEQATTVAAGFTGQATLTADPSQPDRDRYRRLLRYVTTTGHDLGATQLARGLARPYDLGTPVARASEYDRLDRQAKQARRRLHHPGRACTPGHTTPATSATQPH